jgi:hypothetical protein
LVFSESAFAEFSFFTPSAPPSTYTFKLIRQVEWIGPRGALQHQDGSIFVCPDSLQRGPIERGENLRFRELTSLA